MSLIGCRSVSILWKTVLVLGGCHCVEEGVEDVPMTVRGSTALREPQGVEGRPHDGSREVHLRVGAMVACLSTRRRDDRKAEARTLNSLR